MRFHTETDAVTYIFESLAKSDWRNRGLDENTRNTAPTLRLLQAHNLLDSRREYAVVTGSKGKGSVTAITANLLKHLGHTVGMITSPHMVSYRERIRINGKAISRVDFLRLVDFFAPTIDQIVAELPKDGYLSPQGIFLAMALKYFDEEGVTCAVIEVGRGGRFDDNALVPNMLSLFTPIVLEHARYLGNSVERIAWHKSGIIKPRSYAYSLPQSPAVMDILRAEAESLEAQFDWVAPADMGKLIETTENGLKVDFGRYGEVNLPFYGHYEIDNASLSIIAAGNMHSRLANDLLHTSPEYVQRIRAGLESVVWAGRCQKLQDAPAVYIDGAINVLSLGLFLESTKSRQTRPLVIVTAVPLDRDYQAIYAQLAQVADEIILTQSPRNITIKFPDEAFALETFKNAMTQTGRDIPYSYAPTIAQAIERATAHATPQGTVLMAVAQPCIGDAFEHYGLFYEQI